METFFLVCLAFGGLFTLASVFLGFVSSAPGADVGHFGHIGHIGHGPGSDAAGHVPPAAHGGHHAGSAHQGQSGRGPDLWLRLPVLNASSVLAFLTWFGAAGFLLMRFARLPAAAVVALAVVAGIAAASVIALFLRKVLAGERVMNPRDYQLEGTLARVTVTIPATGAGEIVFSKAGVRRSEAARSLTGELIPRETEVVILQYARGVAGVEPWRQLLERDRIPALPPTTAAAPTTQHS
jgi:hypothetical protein